MNINFLWWTLCLFSRNDIWQREKVFGSLIHSINNRSVTCWCQYYRLAVCSLQDDRVKRQTESSLGDGEAFNNNVRWISLQDQSQACNIFLYEELTACNQSIAPPTVQFPNCKQYIHHKSYKEYKIKQYRIKRGGMSLFQYYFEMLNLESMRLLRELCSRVGSWGVSQVKHVGTQLALFSPNQHLIKCSETTFLQTGQRISMTVTQNQKRKGTNIIHRYTHTHLWMYTWQRHIHTHTHTHPLAHSFLHFLCWLANVCCKVLFHDREDIVICLCNCVNTKLTTEHI